jgi:mannose/fructose/N-acetylgalactosamine-specific phosphotransferase system component IIC
VTGAELALAWLGLGVLGAVLAVDETAFAQTWLSQPLPAALLTGLVLGEPAAALVPGVFMQFLVLGNLPVGMAGSQDASSATVGVVGGALVAGWTPASAAGLFGWPLGLMLVLMALASWAAGKLVTVERHSHLAWKLASYRELRDGDFTVVDRLHRRALRVCALRGAGVSLLLALLVSLGWAPLVSAMPAPAQRILGLAPWLVLPLVLGAMSDRMGHRRAAPWLLTALAIGLALGRWAP